MTERLPATWRGLATFVRHPQLPDRATGVRLAAFGPLASLFALDLVLMFVLVGIMGLAAAAGFKMPGHVLEQVELGPLLLAFIVVGGPIGEEIAFRGWLSGRPGHIAAALIVIAALAGIVIAAQTPTAPAAGLAILGLVGAVLVLAPLAIFLLRRRGAIGWFQRHFRWFYFASALAFATVHLTNYSEGAAVILLPLVLPQLLLGLILGYLRVTWGLWSSVLLHMVHNGLLISLVLAGQNAAA